MLSDVLNHSLYLDSFVIYTMNWPTHVETLESLQQTFLVLKGQSALLCVSPVVINHMDGSNFHFNSNNRSSTSLVDQVVEQ